MAYVFKDLSGEWRRDESASAPTSTALGPPPYVTATFGFMGAVGVIVSIATYILDVVSDGLLAYALWRQAALAQTLQEKDDAYSWFVVTVVIIIVPVIVINIFSLLWYWQNKQCLGDYCILHKMTKCQVAFRIVSHALFLGQLIRYIDILRYGHKMQQEIRAVEMGPTGTIQRRTPRGEVTAVLQLVISRDSAMLDMMHSFLQDTPQLVFQIFLLYRSPKIITGDYSNSDLTLAIQAVKIIVALFAISWSLVSYQDELRRSTQDKTPLSCAGTVTCLLWRVAMVGSRVLAIASFAAIKQSQNIYETFSTRGDSRGLVLPYSLIAAIVFGAHWLIMIVWIHAQKTNFCASDTDGSRRPCLEFFYNIVMGWVHVFCYINLKDTPSRRRMAFYYLLNFVENTIAISIWYDEMVPWTELWFRMTIVFAVEAMFVVGLTCLIGYYAYLHPDRGSFDVASPHASWRR